MSDSSARVLVRLPRPDPTLAPSADLRPRDLHATMPGYAVTPLRPLPDLATALGVGELWIKDEAWRLELPSFKILGGSWAVHRLIMDRAGEPVAGSSFEDLRRAASRLGPLVLACATDGNHGRGVARVARLLGLDAVVYVPAGTATARIDDIAAEGARVVVHDGTYDDAVDAVAARASTDGWLLVADVSREPDDPVPGWVIDGYDTIFDEADEQLPGPPTAMLVQTGVGALTASALRHHLRRPAPLPAFATVEPLTADCVLASARAGALSSIDADQSSMMAGLNCGTPSVDAWPVIDATVTAFLAVGDDRAAEAMRLLADAGVVAGESGAAGLAGLLEAAEREDVRAALRLDGDARVLLLNTEGATDPDNYIRVVGRRPEEVRSDGNSEGS